MSETTMPLLSYDEYGDPYWMTDHRGKPTRFDMENTIIYSHGIEHLGYDHLFRELDDDDTQGIYITRDRFDKMHGSGMFSMLMNEMIEVGFEAIFSDEPSEFDKNVIEADWEQHIIPRAITNKMIKEFLDE